ncbi:MULTISPECIES: paraquat-inducible protein A [unclassified Pseudomonas]|uniref:paraquat-inducible protein A n=1 Tax=unclassified Pseudomonas TaxID=196821 RepID=UPI000BE3220D|nr:MULTISPECIES: paraquat-inducible protein A [unclassified Pseudomonas]
MNTPPIARHFRLCLCHSCGKACNLSGQPSACDRCGAVSHVRKINSLTRTWAFLIAALLFYVPANFLPVMNTSLFGSNTDSTIMNGVLEFWAHGAWDIALIIFIASVAVPSIKFSAMIFLLVTVQRHSVWGCKERSQLYRFVELIGCWSMLDVIVVALVGALVKFHGIANIEPRIGILFFGLVVVLTMLSAMSFDSRLIWDTTNIKESMDEFARH